MTASFYPIFLDLEGLACLVVGLGSVGMRKLAFLLPSKPALVRVRDIRPPCREGQALLDQAKSLGIETDFSQSFSAADLDGVSLAFACSADHALNARLAHMCRERRILCNCADDPSKGSFHLPVVVRDRSLTIALSTDRASPALARRWKDDLAAFLAPRAPLAALMGRLRPMVLALELPSATNREIFRRLAVPDLDQDLAGGNWDRARLFLESNLPASLLPAIDQLLEEAGCKKDS